MANIVLHVDDVQKSFGGLHALTDIDLQIEEGKTHAIIGPNGAGKSTLLNVCVGRLTPDAGAVRLRRQMLTGKQPHEINQLGVARVFQTPEIFPDLSVLENVMIPALAKRDGAFRSTPGRRSTARRDLREQARGDDRGRRPAGPHATSEAASLSRGDKRRLELAMCLVQHPRLLLLDEPTAGMSRHDTNRTIDLLKKIKARGMTKVIIEHDMHVVFSLADRVTVLAAGPHHRRGRAGRGARRPEGAGSLSRGRPPMSATMDRALRRRARRHRRAGRRRADLSSPAATSTPITARATSCRASPSTSARARSWRCSAATAPARPRRCAPSPAPTTRR